MAIGDFRDFIYPVWYKDSTGKKISLQRTNESYQIVKNKFLLKEIPDEYYKVYINNYFEIPLGKIPQSNEYTIDYYTGEVTFNESENSKTVTVSSYFGRGMIYIFADRVISDFDEESNTIQETLGDIARTFKFLGEYNPETQYSIRNTVYYAGGSYICISSCKGVTPANGVYWQKIASPGLGLVYRGNYDNELPYIAQDFVYYSNSFYYCKVPSTGHLPTDESYWSPISFPRFTTTTLKNVVTVGSEAVSSIDIGISDFNPLTDDLTVIQNTTQIWETVDYTVSGTTINKISGTWDAGTVFYFKVLKSAINELIYSDGSMLQNETVNKYKLTTDVQNTLASVGNVSTLGTTDKTSTVNAINEVRSDLVSHKAEIMQYEGRKYQINNPYKNGGSLALKGQLHCHTTNSDGVESPYAIVTAYKNAGYDFIAITDHDYITPDPNVGGITFIQGVEETNESHVLAYDITEQSLSKDVQITINDHRAKGELCTIAHPSWSGSPIGELEILTYYNNNFQEVLNGTLNDEVIWDKVLTSGRKIFGTAGDDCHDITGTAFNVAYVVVFSNENSKDAILQSLRDGNFYFSTGNNISINVSGNVITASSIQSSNFSFIGENGRILQTNNGMTSATYTIKGDELYVRVKSVRVADSKTAWSQPIFVDCQGDDGRTQIPLVHSIIKNYPKKNLLHNWDFRHPINQRGATSYSGNKYTIDRWRTYNDVVVTLTNGAISDITYNGSEKNANLFTQYIEFPERLRGVTLTATLEAEVTTGSIKVAIFNGSTGYGGAGISGNGTSKASCTIHNSATTVYVFIATATAEPASFKPIRIKLEVGTFSTLEYDTSFNYAEQLALCQRYGIAVPGFSTMSTYSVFGTVVAETATFAVGIIPLPVSMRGVVSLAYVAESVVGNFYLRNGTNTIAATNITITGRTSNGVKVNVTVAGGLVAGQAYELTTRETAASLFLSADL